MSCSKTSPRSLATESCFCCGAPYLLSGCTIGPDCNCDYWLAEVDACTLCHKCYQHCQCSEEDRRGAIVRKALVDFVLQTKGAAAKPDHILPYQALSYWDKKVDQEIYKAVAKDVQQRQTAQAKHQKLNMGN